MSIELPPETAFREALEARGFWRSAVLNDPELGFLMVEEAGTVLSVNDHAADILLGVTADRMIGRNLCVLLAEPIARERLRFVRRVLESQGALLVTSIFRGVRCRCIFRRLPGDAGLSGHVLWTVRRAPIPWDPPGVEATLEVVEAEANDWGPLGALSAQERRLLAHLAAGLTAREAAARAEVPADEAAVAERAIYGKLHTDSPAALAKYAVAAGFVAPERLMEVGAGEEG